MLAKCSLCGFKRLVLIGCLETLSTTNIDAWLAIGWLLFMEQGTRHVRVSVVATRLWLGRMELPLKLYNHTLGVLWHSLWTHSVCLLLRVVWIQILLPLPRNSVHAPNTDHSSWLHAKMRAGKVTSPTHILSVLLMQAFKGYYFLCVPHLPYSAGELNLQLSCLVLIYYLHFTLYWKRKSSRDCESKSGEMAILGGCWLSTYPKCWPKFYYAVVVIMRVVSYAHNSEVFNFSGVVLIISFYNQNVDSPLSCNHWKYTIQAIDINVSGWKEKYNYWSSKDERWNRLSLM